MLVLVIMARLMTMVMLVLVTMVMLIMVVFLVCVFLLNSFHFNHPSIHIIIFLY